MHPWTPEGIPGLPPKAYYHPCGIVPQEFLWESDLLINEDKASAKEDVHQVFFHIKRALKSRRTIFRQDITSEQLLAWLSEVAYLAANTGQSHTLLGTVNDIQRWSLHGLREIVTKVLMEESAEWILLDLNSIFFAPLSSKPFSPSFNDGPWCRGVYGLG
jgi:hypothetical protein